jgi:hypothetical protein
MKANGLNDLVGFAFLCQRGRVGIFHCCLILLHSFQGN